MRIKSVRVSDFRRYCGAVTLTTGNLGVLVGKNDVGKSTILEALDIFFNEGRGCVKFDKDDINKDALADGRSTVEIAVEFEDLPTSIVIDATNVTTLADEYLLTAEGTLQVVKQYTGAGKERVFIRCAHPTHPVCADLLQKKNPELKSIVDEQGLTCEDKTRNAALRKAIWRAQNDLQLSQCDVEVSKSDAKDVWERLKSYMPLYTLFQSDRKNSDGDSEVQDPMRLAVKEILGDPEIQSDLIAVASRVQGRLDEVASRTLAKLREMNPQVAESLNPRLPDVGTLKWADVFKAVSIAGDGDIPVNKRGSGVKRLILLNFFRAEAERRQGESNLPHIVYAIEEPETSQHPEHQRMLVDALRVLAGTEGAQVLLTTHSPEIVKRLDFEDILLVSSELPVSIQAIARHELPYPSLNEVNYAAFDELSREYHNELYGFIEAEGALQDYKSGRSTKTYTRLNRDGSETKQEIVLTEYVRHQIHHPENDRNSPFSDAELRSSIEAMREYIQKKLSGPGLETA